MTVMSNMKPIGSRSARAARYPAIVEPMGAPMVPMPPPQNWSARTGSAAYVDQLSATCAMRAPMSPPITTAMANGYTRSSRMRYRAQRIERNPPTSMPTNAKTECHAMRNDPMTRSGSNGSSIRRGPAPFGGCASRVERSSGRRRRTRGRRSPGPRVVRTRRSGRRCGGSPEGIGRSRTRPGEPEDEAVGQATAPKPQRTRDAREVPHHVVRDDQMHRADLAERVGMREADAQAERRLARDGVVLTVDDVADPTDGEPERDDGRRGIGAETDR